VEEGLSKVLLVGSPNTGKSLLFNSLTGIYTSVSNYPGTTVEVARGKIKIGGESFEVLDTPGMYSLMPVTEEEDVTRQILMNKKAKVVIHVIDAKNLDRMLPLTLQLIEAGLPIILVLNMMDEAKNRGIDFDERKISERLGIPVFKTIAISGEGLSQLKDAISGVTEVKDEGENKRIIDYGEIIESAVSQIKPMIGNYHMSKRSLALLLLQGDQKIRRLVEAELEIEDLQRIERTLENVQTNLNQPVRYVSAIKSQSTANRIVSEVIEESDEISSTNIGEKISRLLTKPITGIPILLLVIYFGLYQFVGVFGAGTLVDYLESTVFEGSINPYVTSLAETYVPWEMIQDLIVGEYGVFTLGLRYAIAIILPIVSTFFFVFAIVEDTGYLPRMSMLIDRVFKKIGLSGRAVIPMTLGFGCGTMATMVTRTLETRRERFIATMLLALAIPCSAQLGVILGILSSSWQATLIWSGVKNIKCSKKDLCKNGVVFHRNTTYIYSGKCTNLDR
jgi:ferrous iron transport protein B